MPSETVPVKVFVKCRPLLHAEELKGARKVVKISGNKTAIDVGGKDTSYAFDESYGAEIKANQIFRDCVEPLMDKVTEGYNLTLLAFGATGSGKSYLMSGTEDDPGLVPCFNNSLFRRVDDLLASHKELFMTASFVEILDDQLTDLLNPHSNEMKVRQHPQLGIFVDGLSELVVRSVEDLASYYEQGNRARKMGASNVQVQRERSHAIFTIQAQQKDPSSGKMGVKSAISMVDLAGVEGAESHKHNENADENSLRIVLDVIGALGDPKKKGGHVPYRDSKVTRLLQESLGGNAITLMFATVSPSDEDSKNSLLTLQQATFVRNIKNEARINVDETDHVISEVRQEIARLRQKLATQNNKDDVLKMEDLIRDLQIAKRQTWEEKERLSIQCEGERRSNLANKGILEWVMDATKKGNKELQEKILLLQKEKDQLTKQYKEKRQAVDEMKEDLQKRITDYAKLSESGKATDADTKERVKAIHELKERLKRESESLKEVKQRLRDIQEKIRTEREDSRGQNQVLRGNAELRRAVEAEERKRLEQEHATLIDEEIDKMKMEKENDKAEVQFQIAQGKDFSKDELVQIQSELIDLKADQPVVTLQIQTLKQEKAKLQEALDNAYKQQKEEMEIAQLQNFQTFHHYREVFEEQKAALEQRYRGLLEDAIQDAVFLSSRNNELTQDNQALKQNIAEMKDKLAKAGTRPSSASNSSYT